MIAERAHPPVVGRLAALGEALPNEAVEGAADRGGGDAEALGDAPAGIGSVGAGEEHQRPDLGDRQVVLLDDAKVVGLGVEDHAAEEVEELIGQIAVAVAEAEACTDAIFAPRHAIWV